MLGRRGSKMVIASPCLKALTAPWCLRNLLQLMFMLLQWTSCLLCTCQRLYTFTVWTSKQSAKGWPSLADDPKELMTIVPWQQGTQDMIWQLPCSQMPSFSWHDLEYLRNPQENWVDTVQRWVGSILSFESARISSVFSVELDLVVLELLRLVKCVPPNCCFNVLLLQGGLTRGHTPLWICSHGYINCELLKFWGGWAVDFGWKMKEMLVVLTITDIFTENSHLFFPIPLQFTVTSLPDNPLHLCCTSQNASPLLITFFFLFCI